MSKVACCLLPVTVIAFDATAVVPTCAPLADSLQVEAPYAATLLQTGLEHGRSAWPAAPSKAQLESRKTALRREHLLVVLCVFLSVSLLLAALVWCVRQYESGTAEKLLGGPERGMADPVPNSSAPLKPEALRSRSNSEAWGVPKPETPELSRSSSEAWGTRTDVLNYGPRNIFRNRDQVRAEQSRFMHRAADDDSSDGKVGRSGAIYNILSILAGGSVLTLPYSFNVAGWAGGAGVLLSVTAILTFTGLLIGRALEVTSDELSRQGVDEESRDFATLALLASGPRLRDIIGCFFGLEVLGFAVNCTINVGINTSLVTGIPEATVIIISTVVSFALAHVSMRALACVSAVSSIAVAIAAVALAWSGLAMPDVPVASHATLQVRGLPSALGIVLFCFGGHPCLPSVYWSMRDRSQFPSACVASILAAMALFGLVATLSYYFYGSTLEKVLTENIGRNLAGRPLPGLQVLQLATAAAFAIKLQGGLPLLFGPISTTVANSLGVGADERCCKGAVRVLVLTTNAAVALFFRDELDVFCSIVGSALTMATSVIFPCWLYWQLVPAHSCLMTATLMAAMAAGVGLAVLGTIDAVWHFAT